jgi:deoxyribose-phosphate aldolase
MSDIAELKKQLRPELRRKRVRIGDRWLKPDLFRFCASALLTDIVRQLEHIVTGRYSAAHRHRMS